MDRKSRQASLARRSGGSVPGITSAEPSTADFTASRENQAGTSSKTIYNAEKAPAADVQSLGNSLALAGTAHVPGATELAISKIEQRELGNTSNPSLEALKLKEASTLSTNLNEGLQSRAETSFDDAVPAAPKPPETTQHGSTAVSSRPKRVARKRYTEVDWYEDLRPTDDESSKVNRGRGESSVPSPEPQHTSSPSKRSPPKRKRRQSAPNSSKRRKGTKGKGKAFDKGNAQRLPLPLTAAPATSLVDSLESRANPTSKDSNMQPGSSDMKRTAKDSVETLPPNDAPEQDQEEDPKKDQSGTAQLEIIEISSASPLSTDKSDSEHDMHEATTEMEHAAEEETHGRGTSMGQKLTDALRNAGLTTQRLPVTNTGSHLTWSSQWASMFQKSCSPISCVSSSRDSLEHGALVTDFDLTQVQSNPVMTQQEGSESVEAAIATLGTVHESFLKTSSPVQEVAACADKSPSQEPHSTGQLSRSQASVVVTDDEVAVGSQWMTLCDDSEAAMGPDRSNSNFRHSIPSYAEDTRAIIQTRKTDTESSSGSSAVVMTDVPTALLTENSGNAHTPESQKPLLTKETPRRSMPLSIPKSTIVDDNGSPRLMERDRAGNLRIGRLLRLSATDSSRSSHERVSEGCPGDYTPHDRPSLSKFHLDMLLEYGVEAEDLLKRRSRSALFRSRTPSGGISIKPSRRTEQQPETRLTTVSPRQTDDSTAVEQKISSSGQDKTPTAAPSSSQRTVGEMGLCTNRSSGGHRYLGKLLSTETTSQFQPSSEPAQPVIQDGTDEMTWISALQTAQRSAHSLLQQTNQVGLIDCRSFLFSYTH